MTGVMSSVVLTQTIDGDVERTPTTVVVVPFSNTSNMPGDDWLSIGITESIVTTLSQLSLIHI